MAKVQGPSGRMVDLVPVGFEVKAEPWTILECEDGTELRIRFPVVAVVRMDGEHDAFGAPVYTIQNTQGTIRITRVGKGLRGEPSIPSPPTQPQRGPEVR